MGIAALKSASMDSISSSDDVAPLWAPGGASYAGRTAS